MLNSKTMRFLLGALVGVWICCAHHTPTLASTALDSTDWGPAGGQVEIGFQEHAATWRTSRMTLHVDPWVCIRRVGGTPQRNDESGFEEPWDNLRGAAFRGDLDGVWTITGSLEEYQGIPTAWERHWMGESRSLPGWGRMKPTSGGRVDVARGRSRTTGRFALPNRRDTFTVSLAYDAAQWGNDLAPLALDSRSAPYPHGTLGWKKGDRMTVEATAARLAGTELSASGETGRSFRQTDAVWTTWRGRLDDRIDLGVLAGSHRNRPWLQEPDSAAQFQWSNWASVQGTVQSANGAHRWTAEWVPHVASALSLSSHHGDWRGTFTLARVQTQGTEDVLPTHAGTPLGTPLLPVWSFDNSWESSAVWRSEGAVSWTHQRMRAGLHVLTLANQWWLEGWGAWTLQTEWPLHLTAGFETWRLEGSPNMPNEGLRWRVGVSHTLVMSPGRPTFAHPCCH
ncbi:MAG: hypothetical protein ACPHX0_07660 [Flavobacteriales bacterium]